MHRRSFLQTAAFQSAISAGVAFAQAGTAQNSLGAGIKLGFDTYSVRAFKWKDIQLLDYAASLKADTVQISDSADYTSTEPTHLAAVKEHAAEMGLGNDAGVWWI